MGTTTRARASFVGLSSTAAAAQLARVGPNTVLVNRQTPLWRRIATQLRDPMILVLLAASALTVATGDHADSAVILLVVTVNTAVGVVQEVRADRAVAALAELATPSARVVRDGDQREIPSSDLVPGDLVVLAEGDVVPADARVLDSAALLLDEAALTGESDAVAKDVDATLSAGTVVARGRAMAVVTATGAASALGRIASLLHGEVGSTPMQRRMARVSRQLAAAAVVLCGIVGVLGLVRGQPLELMAVTAISLVVAAVPESLPAVVTLGLALGARRMAARNAIVRRLSAVETLGSVTVIAMDKTGTLTEGRMVARRLWTPAGDATVSGSGYSPEGQVLRHGLPASPVEDRDCTDLLTAAVLCNDARIRPPESPDGEWTCLGDPTEGALLAAAARFGLDQSDLEAAAPRVAEVPFDSARKRMTTVHRTSDGRYRVVCKGAPEVLLRRPFLIDDDETIDDASNRADVLAREGYRVLAIAETTRNAVPAQTQDSECGLSLLGLVAVLDPPRTAAAETIRACRDAGITPVLITGDHPETARTIARAVGLANRDTTVVDGRQLPARSLPNVAELEVFARATVEQKVDVVRALQDAGEVVAMTGDGVNDGPALRRADIGVAMGRRGTEVARQAADLVLADDELRTLVAAVEEGRRVYANVRRFLLYGLAGGTAEILVMLAGPFLGLALPLLPAQILWINLLTHGLPGVALAAEPTEGDVMHQKPRSPYENVLGGGLWQRILRIGFLTAVVTLAVAVWSRETGRPWQSMAFLTLGTTQLGVALASRARPRSLANPFLLVSVAVALMLQFSGVALPVLRDLLGTDRVAVADLLIVSAVSLVGFAGVYVDRALHHTHSTTHQDLLG